MSWDTLMQYKWGIMTPEWIILGVGIALSLIDLLMPNDKSRRPLGWFAFVGVIVAIVSLVALLPVHTTTILNDSFRLDSFGKAFKLLLLFGAAFVLLLSIDYQPREGMKYYGEFYYLFLTALLGAMVMTSSGDLITLFVGLELLSISSYILAGLRKAHSLSNESALKYVINGGISTAITLFGMSYVFGLTGSTNLKKIGMQLSTLQDSGHQYVLALAFLLLLVGLSFKLSSVPFHMWAPDVYQGAPTPVTAFLSVVSKTAGFVIVLRLFITIFAAAPAQGKDPSSMLLSMQDYIAFLAGATMVIGNVIALKQRNIKRLFAYSSIAHAGYILVGFASMSWVMIDSIWFYLAAYLLMNLGAFAVLQIITDQSGSEDISQFAGLYRRHPLLAVLMGIFILSLAGIPGTAGFIGKVHIFLGAFATDPAHYVLASVMVAATVVSYVYYFGLFTQIFFRPAAVHEPIKLPIGAALVALICAVGTLVFGVLPGMVYHFLDQFQHFDDFLH
ncbi:NADH-quinone oxidoreductase subunit N [Anoxybacillus sp. UARK-01]|jgi:NADH-quinone oxidoreductase subunit N|uniref:NADH-quinone oxidoreductase subunit N n=1 Tax=Anoxybacteroides rupiense TaxID=311460 RepID=A0ABD5IYC3_9BACL|nr:MULTISPECIES: NADH-quinone oxidoreductase subunit NuoN [Anoxybacillus]MED5052371.1 NADH-quinone oxidoreductase subunit NuoN [Anoxybacillus rupiensis]OQM47449.1 NADH-quinone oxidoreductase subunit N [Anoxybacillus sp. UARK-01]